MSTPDTATILIVDDNPTNLRVLVDYLRGLGYRTLVATGGERALMQLEHTVPDLILLDVMMQGIDGYETCRRIKANPATGEVPVIFMTALAETEHKLNGFRAGAVDYVTKPFQQEEVSARISTHLMIQRQRRQLEELNATKDKFFSVIGHDLRGPFTVLLGFSEIFADPERELTREQQQRFGSMINQSARNAHNLLENLLTWAGMERGTMEFRPQPINLATSAHETVDLLRNMARVKNITLTHALDEQLIVIADRNMLDTILRNLLSNAIKFTLDGGAVTLSAHVQEQEANPMVLISVSDNGIGMPDEVREHVMSAGSPLSTEGTSGETGTGLGLLLCREFVARSGGEIQVESVEGEGTKFSFTLPLKDS